MIKVFTTNKNNKIELTKEELKELLDEAYWEGYKANSHSWTYTTPTPSWTPYQWTTTSTPTNSTLTLNTTADSATSCSNENNIVYSGYVNTMEGPTI